MRSSKSRSRSKSNRNRPSGGNVVNRVFDSSGPEGKVRGTPQQIIDKYNQLARDAQLGNDRVAAENFQQHAEHYLRMLSEAQREMEQRRDEQERQNRERQAERDRERAERQEREAASAPAFTDPAGAPQPDVINVLDGAASDAETGLVETPESKPRKSTRSRSKTPRTRKPKAPVTDQKTDAQTGVASDDGATTGAGKAADAAAPEEPAAGAGDPEKKAAAE
ncbi:MAG: DUF4167 domain-containing protein [Marinibacterium sp.]